MRVKSDEHTPPDISKGSAAQVEVVDFAFMIVSMLYCRLEEYPIYLDELGHSFDEQHRINVMNFVKELMEVGKFSQMFLISHYAGSYGSFTQAETLVMDSTNIVVPEPYNQHVTME
jgi:hypothetical protein